jgi:hypothetical protein
MTQETINTAKSMLASGLNMNQIASMLMVDRLALSAAMLDTPVKTKKTPKVETETLFPDEPGL